MYNNIIVDHTWKWSKYNIIIDTTHESDQSATLLLVMIHDSDQSTIAMIIKLS